MGYVSDTLPNWQQTAIDVIKSNLGAMLKANYEAEGKSALESTCTFVQEEIFRINKEYIRPIELESMTIKSGVDASEHIRDEVAPGKPVPEFLYVPEVGKLNVRVTQLGCGVPSQNVTIRDNDCANTVLGRMRKNNRHLKNATELQLFRYNDVVMGPRQMPVPFRGDVNAWEKESGLAEITSSISNQKGQLQSDGKQLGEKIVCIIR